MNTNQKLLKLKVLFSKEVPSTQLQKKFIQDLAQEYIIQKNKVNHLNIFSLKVKDMISQNKNEGFLDPSMKLKKNLKLLLTHLENAKDELYQQYFQKKSNYTLLINEYFKIFSRNQFLSTPSNI